MLNIKSVHLLRYDNCVQSSSECTYFGKYLTRHQTTKEYWALIFSLIF